MHMGPNSTRPVAPIAPVAAAPQTNPQPRDKDAGENAAVSSAQPLLSAELIVEAGELVVEQDEEAGRFVAKVIDPDSEAILRQFPTEGQLAFSRALRAYVNALRERK